MPNISQAQFQAFRAKAEALGKNISSKKVPSGTPVNELKTPKGELIAYSEGADLYDKDKNPITNWNLPKDANQATYQAVLVPKHNFAVLFRQPFDKQLATTSIGYARIYSTGDTYAASAFQELDSLGDKAVVISGNPDDGWLLVRAGRNIEAYKLKGGIISLNPTLSHNVFDKENSESSLRFNTENSELLVREADTDEPLAFDSETGHVGKESKSLLSKLPNPKLALGALPLAEDKIEKKLPLGGKLPEFNGNKVKPVSVDFSKLDSVEHRSDSLTYKTDSTVKSIQSKIPTVASLGALSNALAQNHLPKLPSVQTPNLPAADKLNKLKKPSLPDSSKVGKLKAPGSLPKVLSLPNAQLPNLNQAESSGLGSKLKSPGLLPNLPKVPTIPNAQLPNLNQAEVPGLDGKLKLPSTANLPKVEVPNLPSTANLTDLKDKASIPVSLDKVPSLKELPKVDASQLPSSANLTSIESKVSLPISTANLALPSVPAIPTSLNSSPLPTNLSSISSHINPSSVAGSIQKTSVPTSNSKANLPSLTGTKTSPTASSFSPAKSTSGTAPSLRKTPQGIIASTPSAPTIGLSSPTQVATGKHLEASIWYFGSGAGVQFDSGKVKVLEGAQLNQLEGSATIADSLGNPLLYSDGQTLWDRNHEVITTGLLGDPSSSTGALIVPKPRTTFTYFVFIADQGGYIGATKHGINYSTVVVNPFTGKAEVIQKNIPLLANATERMAAVGHANGKDYWLITQPNESDKFYSYLINQSGVSTSPVVSSGFPTSGIGNTTIGFLKASPDGSKLALSNAGNWHVEVYDFDPSTGKASNPWLLSEDVTHYMPDKALSNPYGLEFSPDGSKLYVSNWKGNDIAEFNLKALTHRKAVESMYKYLSTADSLRFGALQLGIDGRIYIAQSLKEKEAGSHSLGVIVNPNAFGSDAGITENAIPLGRGLSRFGLPATLNTFVRNTKPDFSASGFCSAATTHFEATAQNQPDRWLWDFGDPESGVANHQSLPSANHNYPAAGAYAVKLIAYKDGRADSITRVVTVTNSALVSLGPDLTLPTDKKLDFDAGTNADAYLWSTGSTNSHITVNSPGRYWVAVLSGICITLDTVNVLPDFNLSLENASQSAQSNNQSFVQRIHPFLGVSWIDPNRLATNNYAGYNGSVLDGVISNTSYHTTSFYQLVYNGNEANPYTRELRTSVATIPNHIPLVFGLHFNLH